MQKREVRFIEVFAKDGKNLVKQKGLGVPPSAPRTSKILGKNADFVSSGTTKVQTPWLGAFLPQFLLLETNRCSTFTPWKYSARGFFPGTVSCKKFVRFGAA